MTLPFGHREPRVRIFSSLRHRNYRLLWIGTLISHTGDWLDQVALNWLVLEQTGSVFYLGIVNLCRGLPILLCTLVGGALADRMERRRLMMVTQSAAMVLASVLAVIVLHGSAPLWAIFTIATLRGVVVSFNLPARQSLISELVPRDDLPNALALNSMTFNLTKVLGPLASGVIIAFFGTAMCFLINAVSFIAVLATLAAMRFPERAVKPEPEPILASIVSGLRFVRQSQVILLLVLVALVPTFVAQPYLHLLAIFAYQVFDIGPMGLGVLTAAASFGSMMGALGMAQYSRRISSGRVMLLLLGGSSLGLAGFALAPSAAIGSLFLILVGATYMSYNISHSSLLQMTVPDAYRGRVLSVLFVNRGLVSLGTAASASVAALVGPRGAFLLMAGIIGVFAILVFTMSPALRRLRA